MKAVVVDFCVISVQKVALGCFVCLTMTCFFVQGKTGDLLAIVDFQGIVAGCSSYIILCSNGEKLLKHNWKLDFEFFVSGKKKLHS